MIQIIVSFLFCTLDEVAHCKWLYYDYFKNDRLLKKEDNDLAFNYHPVDTIVGHHDTVVGNPRPVEMILKLKGSQKDAHTTLKESHNLRLLLIMIKQAASKKDDSDVEKICIIKRSCQMAQRCESEYLIYSISVYFSHNLSGSQSTP